MKKTGLILLLLVACLFSCADKKDPKSSPVTDTVDSAVTDKEPPVLAPFPDVDISPMDMSYFPIDYPKLKMAHTAEALPLARVIYSRPHLQGRRLFPDILKYSEPWRLGANEATELQLFRDAVIQGKKMSAGRYALYCIPQPNKWIIVFNSNIDTWGLHPDSTKDIARFEIPVSEKDWKLEYFSMVFEKTATGADLVMGWDHTEARLPLQF